jgi:transposase
MLGIPTDNRSPFDDAPSYEELKEVVAALRLLTEQQSAQIAELEYEIAKLKERLARNPRNSSMPPSAEGLTKPVAGNRAERRAAKRRPGKQPGSEGKNLAQVESPDAVVTHTPAACTSCGAALADAGVIGVERRQVFELPEVRAHVTEHRMERRRCACGCETKATAPPEATAPACYGPGIRALAVYLSVYQHVPYDRLAEIFADVVGIPVSVGAITSMVAKAGGRLGLFVSVVTDLLRDAPTVHFDETGARVEGSLHWVHVASNALYTLPCCHKRRGGVAMDDIGVIAKMTRVAVHDGWKPYRAYDVVHALCNAHLCASSTVSSSASARSGPSR